MSLFALAMNPNISNDDFLKLSDEILKDRNDRIDRVMEDIKTKPIEEQIFLFQKALPFILMF